MTTLPKGIADNKGIVGVDIGVAWSDVDKGPKANPRYDWSKVDSEITQSAAAGLKVQLLLIASSEATPPWVLDGTLQPVPKSIALIDAAADPSKKTYCDPITTTLYWDTTYHQARQDFITAAGAHFNGNANVVAVTTQFANHRTADWNILDTVGTFCDQEIDQPAQWLAAGWTEPVMLGVGQSILDTTAAAFPSKYIKLPIGGLEPRLASKDGGKTPGEYSTLALDIERYVFGDSATVAQPYADRFYIQRNTVSASWQVGTYYDNNTPSPKTQFYINYMIRQRAKLGHAGLQMVQDVTGHADRMAGNTSGCAVTDTVCIMGKALDVAQSYGVDYIEIFTQDAQNPAFYKMISDATIAMGGTPRKAK